MAGQKRTHRVDVVSWRTGVAVYLNDERIAGPKPPFGAKIIASMTGNREQTLHALTQGATLKERR